MLKRGREQQHRNQRRQEFEKKEGLVGKNQAAETFSWGGSSASALLIFWSRSCSVVCGVSYAL